MKISIFWTGIRKNTPQRGNRVLTKDNCSTYNHFCTCPTTVLIKHVGTCKRQTILNHIPRKYLTCAILQIKVNIQSVGLNRVTLHLLGVPELNSMQVGSSGVVCYDRCCLCCTGGFAGRGRSPRWGGFAVPHNLEGT